MGSPWRYPLLLAVAALAAVEAASPDDQHRFLATGESQDARVLLTLAQCHAEYCIVFARVQDTNVLGSNRA